MTKKTLKVDTMEPSGRKYQRTSITTMKWLRRMHLTLMLTLGFIMGGQASEYLAIRQDEKARELHRLDSLNLLSYVSLMILITCTVWFFKHKRVRFLHDFFHETGLAIIYGLIVGAIIRYSGSDSKITQMSVQPKYPSETNVSSDAPPDMLWIDFEVPDRDKTHIFMNKSKESKSYAYIFKGELFINKKNSKPQAKGMFSEKATFDPEIFFNLILPVIVFNAGYSMKNKSFFRNLGAIFVYAFFGTLISCVVVAMALFAAKFFMPIIMKEFNLADCFYFGAIISATDPVTVLAIFTDLRVDVRLNALVFGEAIFNDVVSIVLASLIEEFKEHIRFGLFYAFSHAIYDFLNIFLFSCLQGSLFGCFTALLTKHTRLCDHPLLESSLFLLMSYASFLLAEVLDLSGIVSVLFCGICQAHYTYNNLSPESRVRTKSLFAIANFIAENFIFAYIGVSMFTFPHHLWSIGFISTSFLAVLIGRALNIYSLSYLMNLSRSEKIPIEFQHILFFSGLRGAMAFGLAIRNTLTEPRRLMLTATSIISIFSIIFCGSTLQWILRCFQIATNVEESAIEDPGSRQQFASLNRKDRSGSMTSDLVASPTDDVSVATIPSGIKPDDKNHYEKAWLVRQWYDFDMNFMKPLLTHSRPSLMETLPSFCRPLAKLLTSAQQMGGDRESITGLNETNDSQKIDVLYLNNDLHQPQPYPENDFEEMKLNPLINRKNYNRFSSNHQSHKNDDGSASTSHAFPTEIIPTLLTSGSNNGAAAQSSSKNKFPSQDNSSKHVKTNVDNEQANKSSYDSSVVLNPEPFLRRIQ